MSAALYWRPVVKNGGERAGDYDLRRALAKKLYHHDGTLSGDWETLDSSIIPYLQGLGDAHVDGAYDLIDAIEKHGKIEVSIRH